LVRKFIGLGYGLKPNLLDVLPPTKSSGYAHTFLNVIVVFLLPSAPNSYIRLDDEEEAVSRKVCASPYLKVLNRLPVTRHARFITLHFFLFGSDAVLISGFSTTQKSMVACVHQKGL
jgi:hypothetical protein